MEKKKKFLIWLIVAVVSLAMLSGCTGLIEMAIVEITFEPNPVPYDSEFEGWRFSLIFTETGGVGVTLSQVRLDSFDQEDRLIYTTIWYEEDFPPWWGSDYLGAYSEFDMGEFWQRDPMMSHTIITVNGIDDLGNFIEATGRVDFLPQ
ncbi:hypothetical protein ES708_29830 [subsurface metagenome]